MANINDNPKGNMLQNENNEDEATPNIKSTPTPSTNDDKSKEESQEPPKEKSTTKTIANAINFMIY